MSRYILNPRSYSSHNYAIRPLRSQSALFRGGIYNHNRLVKCCFVTQTFFARTMHQRYKWNISYWTHHVKSSKCADFCVCKVQLPALVDHNMNTYHERIISILKRIWIAFCKQISFVAIQSIIYQKNFLFPLVSWYRQILWVQRIRYQVELPNIISYLYHQKRIHAKTREISSTIYVITD